MANTHEPPAGTPVCATLQDLVRGATYWVGGENGYAGVLRFVDWSNPAGPTLRFQVSAPDERHHNQTTFVDPRVTQVRELVAA